MERRAFVNFTAFGLGAAEEQPDALDLAFCAGGALPVPEAIRLLFGGTLAFHDFYLDLIGLSASWEVERYDMDMQAGIKKLLENFTKDLLKLFSAGLLETVEQVAFSALPGASVSRAPRRRGRPPKDASSTAPS
jgi:hypothetical protein